jgi:LysM repeat protein
VLYTVQEKDTIASVAEKFNVSSIDIIFANQLYNSQTLYTGQVSVNNLIIPQIIPQIIPH